MIKIRLLLLVTLFSVSSCGVNFYKNKLYKHENKIKEILVKHPELADSISRVEKKTVDLGDLKTDVTLVQDTAQFDSLLNEYTTVKKLVDSLAQVPPPDPIHDTIPLIEYIDNFRRPFITAQRRLEELRAELRTGAYVDSLTTIVYDTLDVTVGEDSHSVPVKFEVLYNSGEVSVNVEVDNLEIETQQVNVSFDAKRQGFLKRLFSGWWWIVIAVLTFLILKRLRIL